MSNNMYRIIIFLLVTVIAACTTPQSNMRLAANDEDKDIGIGGTGMLAATGSGSGLGGTGILGKITGFGSIFVNGIEIEYDNETAFTIDGKTAEHRQLEIGDVVEVLTTDGNDYTQAQIINLRHEVIGKVEAVDAQTFSFTVNGQSVIQPVHQLALPEVGATVAVSGYRVDEKTILSTRVTPAVAGQSLIRAQTDLPFSGRAVRWLVQTHVKNDSAAFELEGRVQTVELEKKSNKTLNDQLGIKILQLRKAASGQLQLDQIIDSNSLPRGRKTPEPGNQPGYDIMPGTLTKPGSIPGSMPGSIPGSMQGTIPGSSQGSQAGSISNMKR